MTAPKPSYQTRSWVWLVVALLFLLVHDPAAVVGCIVLVALNARWADEDERR